MRKQDGAGIGRMGSALSRVVVLRAGGFCAHGRRPALPGSHPHGPWPQTEGKAASLSFVLSHRGENPTAVPWEQRSADPPVPTSSRWCFPTPRLAVQLHHRHGGGGAWGRPGVGVRQADLDAAL